MENKKVKICIISYHTSPVESVGEGSSGGMSIYLSNLCKRISKNMEVDIFCRGKGNERNFDRCNLIYLNSMSLEEFQEQIIRFHVKNRYDIIHSHYWLSGIVARRIKKLFPALIWVHSFHTIEALKKVTCDKVRIEKEKDIIHLCDFIVSPTYEETLIMKILDSTLPVILLIFWVKCPIKSYIKFIKIHVCLCYRLIMNPLDW
ncbi:MAG: glycosyltransferase [candidate division WOR-3 bacterium]